MSEKKVDFEKSMEELEEIVEKLENGDLNLDESVELFEQGINISKECNKILENAERRITMLLQKDGKIEEENFSA